MIGRLASPIRRLAGRSARTVACTPELRLDEVEVRPDGVHLHVEARSSDAFGGLIAGPWKGAEVKMGLHWLDGRGRPLVWDGQRSERLVTRWLALAPQRRRIRVGSPPPGARELQVELVAEDVQWGDSAGLGPLRFVAPGIQHLTPSAGEPRPRGVPAPDEPAAVTRKWLTSGWPADAPPDEMARYVGADLARFLMSVQLMPEDPGRVLEIGANPYFISRLVRRRFPGSELRMTNYFGHTGGSLEQNVVDAAGAVLDTFRSELVDTETAPLPYESGAFDTVLLCEVIEHLVKDPAFQLAEIARVLKVGGTFVLTTPNVARAGNRLRLAQRQGIYDPYSRYGPHGRHNREYTAEELFELVAGIGFEPALYLTRPVHHVTPDADWFSAADDDGAGDYHFLVTRRGDAAPVQARPDWLYR
jgi:SAM-dependent methyltransferase